MHRHRFIIVSTAMLVGTLVAGNAAVAASRVASITISGTAVTTCASYDEFGGCLPGTSTTSTFTGTTGTCTGTCATTAGTIDIALQFVKYPPSPWCQANKVAGTLTLAYPNDPAFPPQPMFVSVSGHLRDDHSIVLTGDLPPNELFPPAPMKVILSPTVPPSPCTPNTGTFTGAIAIG
jgi:hypothetical protein